MSVNFPIVKHTQQDSAANKPEAHPGERLISRQEWPAISMDLRLTARESEVVVLLFQGRSCESIAHRLSIKSRTVRQFLEQVYRKLDVQDRVALVLRIVESRDKLRR